MPAATRGDLLANARQPALLDRGQAAWHLLHTGCQPWLVEVCKCPANTTSPGQNGCALQGTTTPYPSPPPRTTGPQIAHPTSHAWYTWEQPECSESSRGACTQGPQTDTDTMPLPKTTGAQSCGWVFEARCQTSMLQCRVRPCLRPSAG